ncbi:MAG TPA: nitroreductase family protein [Acidimicrobiales bacterium]|nr:nitroreductase family protein [Acidimicrobiales bacterium]
MTTTDLATIDHLLTTTRAVRKRLDLSRPVPREVVLDCIRLANQAPTGTNAQTWRWIVVTDPDVRSALGTLYRDRPPQREGPNPAPVVEDTPGNRRMLESTQYLTDHIHEVPVLVVPCAQEVGGAAGWQPSIYPAVWSFMLALRSRGLGSCLTTSHLYRKDEAAELLGVPAGFAQACLVPVAYFTGDDFRPADRRPAEEVTYWDHWGKTDL